MARRRANRPLNVFLNGRHVGVLRRESTGAIDFQYARAWLDLRGTFPVSLSRPLREDRDIGAPVINVFDNLLPDSAPIRRRVASVTISDRMLGHIHEHHDQLARQSDHLTRVWLSEQSTEN
ncbi:HipA N-terminal domain-containing protein [Methylobacterium sp. J-030]|uniref:HipA N-terminal domain-containing protein n=1 Tax=Methylobacterium sp. J-030 TaxID=2836627 RepID=UPI001FB9383C|nr:HipA N-terminal domain-containing protein [Methylobacterium sp. J-030]MCJ2072094.1 HipA N-terminal domain-containing protein [Methylobacterium sp. J-030]